MSIHNSKYINKGFRHFISELQQYSATHTYFQVTLDHKWHFLSHSLLGVNYLTTHHFCQTQSWGLVDRGWWRWRQSQLAPSTQCCPTLLCTPTLSKPNKASWAWLHQKQPAGEICTPVHSLSLMHANILEGRVKISHTDGEVVSWGLILRWCLEHNSHDLADSFMKTVITWRIMSLKGTTGPLLGPPLFDHSFLLTCVSEPLTTLVYISV